MRDFADVRVLVVDDSSIWRTFMVRHLSEAGLSAIDEAFDGVQAVFKARTLQVDLILMDVRLPYMDGIEAAARIREDAPEVKVLFVSGEYDPDVRRAALEAGACDYILKALVGRQLIPAIRRALRPNA